MRCYFLRDGHIADVELLPGLDDAQAVQKSRELFETLKDGHRYEGFEVWEQARKIIAYSCPDARARSGTPHDQADS